MSYFTRVCIASGCVPAQQEEAISSQLINAALLHYEQLQFKLQFFMSIICN